MDTDVRYTMTRDGVRIGYAVSGAGPVLISMPDIGFSSMLQTEQDLPEMAAWAEALSQHFTYVRYDARGFGVSQRDVEDLSVATWSLDLDAVVERVGAPFVLFGYLGSARLAYKYTSEHPEQISRVITWPADYPITTAPEGEMLRPLAEEDWESFTETLAHIALGWEAGWRANRLAAVWRNMTSQSLYLQYLEQFQWPSEPELARYRTLNSVPILILARRHKYMSPRIAAFAQDPNVRLRLLPGDEAMPFDGNMGLIVQNMLAFVAAGLVTHDLEASPTLRSGATPSRTLSDREMEVLRLVAAAKSNSEIADELVLSVRTVERHLMRIYDKLGVTGKSARLVAAAYAHLQDAPAT